MADLERAIGARGLASPEYATVAGLVLHHMERLWTDCASRPAQLADAEVANL
jgi:hypothetical protein